MYDLTNIENCLKNSFVLNEQIMIFINMLFYFILTLLCLYILSIIKIF